MAESDAHKFKDRFMLRLPDGMRDRIKAAAAENGRSMNSEIVGTLQEAYPDYDEFTERMSALVVIAADLLKEQGLTERSEGYFDILGSVMNRTFDKLDFPEPKYRTRDEPDDEDEELNNIADKRQNGPFEKTKLEDLD